MTQHAGSRRGFLCAAAGAAAGMVTPRHVRGLVAAPAGSAPPKATRTPLVRVADLAVGETMKVDLCLASSQECLCVPVESVFRKLGRDVVFRREGRRYIETEVELGLWDPFFAEVKGGDLGPGDQVALDDPTMVKGVRVVRL